MNKKVEISSATKIANNIKYLRLGLENVEVFDIDINDFDFYEANDIKINHFYSGINKSFSAVKVSNSVSILLNKRLASAKYIGYDKCTYNIFNRLIKYSDIVDITYLDKTKMRLKQLIRFGMRTPVMKTILFKLLNWQKMGLY